MPLWYEISFFSFVYEIKVALSSAELSVPYGKKVALSSAE